MIEKQLYSSWNFLDILHPFLHLFILWLTFIPPQSIRGGGGSLDSLMVSLQKHLSLYSLHVKDVEKKEFNTFGSYYNVL